MNAYVVKIPRVYFDTRDIIEMVRLRKGTSKAPAERLAAYDVISKAVVGGFVTVLFNSAACLEWVEGHIDAQKWNELSEFFQTAKQVLEVDMFLAFTLELIEETRRHIPSLSLPKVEIIREVLSLPPELIALSQYHPDLQHLRTQRPFTTPGISIGSQEWTKGTVIFAQMRPATMRARIDNWREAVMLTREHYLKHKAKGIEQSGKMHWANNAHRLGDILSSFDPSIDQIELAKRIDFDFCPACSVFLNALWRYAKGLPDKGPHENDADDWLQVPAIVYADYSLIENKLRKHLIAGTPGLKTRVFSDPIEFARKLKLL